MREFIVKVLPAPSTLRHRLSYATLPIIKSCAD
jgi:hypothetical protein